VQAFNNWFNTPDPCVKKQLEQDNPYTAGIVSDFSLLNLTVGPWNTAPGGAPGAWGLTALGSAWKAGTVPGLNSKFPGWGDKFAKVLKWGIPPLVAYSTYRHVQAVNKSSECGCKQ
jgi:hypothetical protein